MPPAWKSTAWVDVSQEVGTLILRIGGELDISSRDAVEVAVLAAIPTAYKVVLDLGDLTFCDSNGIAIFIAAHEKANAQGTALVIGNLQPAVARVFEVSGVDRMLVLTE